MEFMKGGALAVLSLLLLTACGASSSPSPSPLEPSENPGPIVSASVPAGAVELTTCPEASAHVYHPLRLKLLAGCQLSRVPGIITHIKSEPDGDYHIRLKPDAGQERFINGENIRQQHGGLVLEPVCANPVTQPSAKAACQSYHNPLQIPQVGTHVIAVGYWVLDQNHGWNELHPLTGFAA